MFDFDTYQSSLKEYEMAQFAVEKIKRSRKHVPDALRRQISVDLPNQYRASLPLYELAVCPICGETVQEAIDTFSLAGIGWRNDGPLSFGWYGRTRPNHRIAKFALQEDGWPRPSYQTNCGHVQGITYGVNLNDIYPNDLRTSFVEIGSEQPGVLRPFIEQDDCTAVLRTLPIGRRDDDKWQPRYTAWFLTYFCRHPIQFRPHLPQIDMAKHGFYWPYSLLTYDLAPFIQSRKIIEMPANETTANKLQGLNGRWAVSGSRLRLIPEKLSGPSLRDRRHPAYFGIEEKENELLATRNLARELILLKRFTKQLTQFIVETPDWEVNLPFEMSETFAHPIHHGFVWTLKLQAEEEKVRLNLHLNRSHAKNKITRLLFLGTAVKLINNLPQICQQIEAIADPESLRIMYQTLVDYAPST